MMFSLSFVGGSKSAEEGPNPLADLDRGSISASGFGPGGRYLLADLVRNVSVGNWSIGYQKYTNV